METTIKILVFLRGTLLSIPLCASLVHADSQIDLKNYIQENTPHQPLCSMQAQNSKEQEFCKSICSFIELACKDLMAHANELDSEDKKVLGILNGLLLDINQDQVDENLYYATLAFSQIITSVLDDVFMETVSYHEDFINNFDVIAYGKSAEKIKKELEL